ncbi:hypothetical protein LJ655_19460 [Paraburkholderia sp. MMS20-SJTN17]|uniref:Uncharacterized protein n=1 Tax=Paraburkholderia translucens TaxID=2886945 RepID=A0ABS8KGZ4_9BURK|nr:hypothetical protein [Paraburkholderia sp. MMS20-SJTN17]MCC8404032.1 hypothetical protein [Paraburkholderia sp. MMS20-SJTN17]
MTRISACVEGRRSRRAARRLAAALATLVVATWLTINALMDASDANGDLHANPAARSARDCSARYAALLDLAELARRDGKSSEVVVRGLSARNGAMSACLLQDRGTPAPQ